jgi:hypothetical protein
MSTRAVTRSRSSRSSRRIASSRPHVAEADPGAGPAALQLDRPAGAADPADAAVAADELELEAVQALPGQGAGRRPVVDRDGRAAGVAQLEGGREVAKARRHLTGVVKAPDADGLGVAVQQAAGGVQDGNPLGQLAEDVAKVGPGGLVQAGRAGRGQIGA